MVTSVRYQPATTSNFKILKVPVQIIGIFTQNFPIFLNNRCKVKNNLIPQSKYLPMERNICVLLFCIQFIKMT